MLMGFSQAMIDSSMELHFFLKAIQTHTGKAAIAENYTSFWADLGLNVVAWTAPVVAEHVAYAFQT